VTEIPLAGGFVTEVVRVGDTVRRPPSPPYARQVLELLARRGWPAAPRILGTDDRGREILSYVDGEVPLTPERQAELRTPAALTRLAGLVRELHDLTAAGDAVACHNDLSPKNTVYRDGLPVAFLDWDLAAPGERVHDVAHVCWQYVGLGPGGPDPAAAAELVDTIATAYGLAERDRLVPTILWWQERCRRGIEAGAAAGEPAMVRLRDLGVVEGVRAAYDWTAAHRDVL
jgi:Phosphotransferase enzyme family